MDAVVDNYDLIDREIQEDMEGLETSVFADDRSSDARQIYALKREVLEMRRAAIPLIEPARRLSEDVIPHVPDVAKPFFRDVSDHLLRSVDHIESYDRLLTDILNAHLAQVGVRQNDDMRKISAWVAIAAIPTADRRHLRDELPPLPGAGLALRLPVHVGDDGVDLWRALPRVQEVRLAVGQSAGPAGVSRSPTAALVASSTMTTTPTATR